MSDTLSPTTVSIDDDGGVTISMPAVRRQPIGSDDFDENLALQMDHDCGGLAHELSEGVDADLQTRRVFIDNLAESMDLLGLTIEQIPGSKQGPVSKIGHPLLLSAVVKSQAAASAELLPSTGPCKVATRYGSDAMQDHLAQAFERDINYYLTQADQSYYPDMDRGLFGLMHSGNLFKKVYCHPLRRRPTSEVIDVADLIVSQDATDLDTAIRVTHRSEITRSQARRMMYFDHWADVPLGEPFPTYTPDQTKLQEIEGVRPISLRPRDTPYTFYETTADICLDDYGFYDRHAPGDLPVSYAVTFERDTKRIVDIRRRWHRDDEMFQRRMNIVHYGMVPALGFLCLGHCHLLGNQTKALRAIWRILVTAGMYANAPGGLRAKTVRTSSNDINPGPGEWTDVDVSGFDKISDAFMPLPYKDVSNALIQFADLIAKESAEASAAADMPMGDSRVDIPVGTILAMIEQATQMSSAVHKRLYRSQAREMMLFKEVFAEHPETLHALNPSPAHIWETAEEFRDVELIPASDPNVPSQMHRIMLATAMVTVAGQNPDIYDRVGVHRRAWASIGVNDAEQFLHEPTPQPPQGGAAPPDPLIGQARMLEAQAKIATAQNDAQDTQRKAAAEAVQTQSEHAQSVLSEQNRMAELASQERVENARLAVERERLAVEQQRATTETATERAKLASTHQLGLGRLAHDRQTAAQEHGLGLASHALDVQTAASDAQGQAADRHLARRQQDQQAQQAERDHSRGLAEIAVKRKVASKPAPRPAGRK